jgi:steroid delta-isomerase
MIKSMMRQLLDKISSDVTPAQVTAVVQAYLDSWTQAQPEARAALFAENVVVEDPVGAPALVGKPALIAFWQSAAAYPTNFITELKHLVVCGNEALVEFTMTIKVMGITQGTILIRENFKLDQAGKIISLRAFWDIDSVS